MEPQLPLTSYFSMRFIRVTSRAISCETRSEPTMGNHIICIYGNRENEIQPSMDRFPCSKFTVNCRQSSVIGWNCSTVRVAAVIGCVGFERSCGTAIKSVDSLQTANQFNRPYQYIFRFLCRNDPNAAKRMAALEVF